MRESLSKGEFLISLGFLEKYVFIAQDVQNHFTRILICVF